MKKRDLIKKLKAGGFKLARSGGDHDIYRRGKEMETVPRHGEITENTAKAIIKRRGL